VSVQVESLPEQFRVGTILQPYGIAFHAIERPLGLERPLRTPLPWLRDWRENENCV
jgi:hypothetical protein